MKIEKIDIYNDKPKEGVNNEYPTPKNSFRFGYKSRDGYCLLSSNLF